MVLSIISSNGISSSDALSSLSSIETVVLIILLSLKEFLSDSKQWNTNLNVSFNIAILPLLLLFVTRLILKIKTMI